MQSVSSLEEESRFTPAGEKSFKSKTQFGKADVLILQESQIEAKGIF